ncbi:PorP/SprF family type IX secretion system membrane protein [Pedobacter nutrimenti]|uniref:PorP/SprF family type IX secretion system membrane protein n=1 Tax=Pedobacter nutrimenti TaxID=1241337 RepID=UPI00292FC2BD|nr:PorP/SprF family type IX secretion system membrane protein [Pedobacter nutrimenti]
MKKTSTYLLLIIAGLACSFVANAQDHLFSQFFNAPLYLNPALTGQFEGDIRANLIYRNQWSSLTGNLQYINASADINIPSFGGGVGLMFNRSNEGSAGLLKNNITATYAYSVGTDEFVLSFGIAAGITNRTINWNKLVFSDQIDPRLGYIPGSVSSADLPNISSRYYFDPAAGINLVYGSFMLGAAVNHINQPDESFTGAQAKLPRRITVNTSYRIPLTSSPTFRDYESSYVIPSIVYYNQDKMQSLSMGAQFKYKSINTGIWYRTTGQGGPDAIVFSLIFDLFKNSSNGERVRLGLSHDATTSKINYTNTSGTTEASVGYQQYFRNSDNYEKFNGLRCYDFY